MTSRHGVPVLVLEALRTVDDAGGEHLEGINTARWFAEAVQNEWLKLEGNIRPDWQSGQKMSTKTRRKVDRWAEELLANNAVMGNLSIRLDPTKCEYDLDLDDETGDYTLTLWSGAFDCAVDSQSRISAILKAAKSDVGTFDLGTRFATRIWLADNNLASRVGSDYNTRGEKVNDTAAKYAYQDSAEKRIARKLLDSPHLGIDNVEVLKNAVSASSSKLVAFNTLSQAMESFWEGEPVTQADEEAQGKFLVDFWNDLVSVRKEFGRLGKTDRQALRGKSMAGTALSIHGVIAVASDLFLRHLDPAPVLKQLAEPVYVGGAQVDYFSYDNPVWMKIGALVPGEGPDGAERRNLRMSFQTRREMAAELRRQLGLVEQRLVD